MRSRRLPRTQNFRASAKVNSPEILNGGVGGVRSIGEEAGKQAEDFVKFSQIVDNLNYMPKMKKGRKALTMSRNTLQALPEGEEPCATRSRRALCEGCDEPFARQQVDTARKVRRHRTAGPRHLCREQVRQQARCGRNDPSPWAVRPPAFGRKKLTRGSSISREE